MKCHINKQEDIEVKQHKRDTNCTNCNWETNITYNKLCGNCFIEQIISKG